MLVLFIKSHTPYLAGEMADFPDARAKALVSRGIASWPKTVEPPPPTSSEPQPGETAPVISPRFSEMNVGELREFSASRGLSVDIDGAVGITAKRNAVKAAYERSL